MLLFWKSKVGRRPLRRCPSPNHIQHPCSGFSPTCRTTWLAITLALAFLLLISTANVSLFLGSRACGPAHLEDGALRLPPAAGGERGHLAAEKEQLGDSCNPFKD